ncbi:hypothetical protein QWY87_09160 [Lutimonas halocynthiae]|uniref:hypothetical protein n=1 Tax=Lutimonas halocynthiae TaxID=1446477 RepID=UPI0025B60BBD|nr:hypothetical protein [Lutimonas halocynthiae]MDN3642866.1 hypothetical protein [Lutimonas halocynthiae]
MKAPKHNKDSRKNHNVILYVDTKNIDKCTIDENSSFDQYDMDKDNHKFKIKVEADDTITWSGLSISSPNDKVIITKIKHESDSNIFGRKNLRGRCCDDNGNVIGTVSNNTKGKSEIYKIYFQICEGNNGGLKKVVFRIDPQIEVDP